MRCGVYARVSTNGAQSPQMQLRELREYCRRRSWKIVCEYTDQGISGANERRPELDRMMADAKRRKFDAVVVYRYDRLARSLRHLVNALEEFRSLGIDFVSLHEGVDTSTPNGRLVFGIFATIAEFERELIRSRVRSGLATAKARGIRLGRPPLKTLSAREVQMLRSDRRKRKVSYSALAKKYGTSVWTAFYLCKQAARR
jgi:DNA invertase Pin-like site-specific DNA recombinase